LLEDTFIYGVEPDYENNAGPLLTEPTPFTVAASRQDPKLGSLIKA
jgi:hypothetical protein